MKQLTFDINNLLCKKEVVLSKQEIVQIVKFAIINKIVEIEVQSMDVEADDNHIQQESGDVLRICFEDTVENVLIKPFDYKDDGECPLCYGAGEYEVSVGSHSFFKDCHCEEKIC